jgi:hypothetical protein
MTELIEASLLVGAAVLVLLGVWLIRKRRKFYQDYVYRKKSGYVSGGLVRGLPGDDVKRLLANPGTIRVSQKVYELYGADFIRRVNDSPCAEIIVTKGPEL